MQRLNCSCVFILIVMLTFTCGQELTSGQNPAVEGSFESNRIEARFSLETFLVIAENNIFNPNRHPDSIANNSPEKAPPLPALSYLDLSGVMIHEEGAIAFFEASDTTQSGACEEGMSVSGLYLMKISNSSVSLENSSQKIELPVGARLIKRGEGEWRVGIAPHRPLNRKALVSLASRNSRNRNRGRRDQERSARANAMRQMLERNLTNVRSSAIAPPPAPAGNFRYGVSTAIPGGRGNAGYMVSYGVPGGGGEVRLQSFSVESNPRQSSDMIFYRSDFSDER